MRNFLIPLLSLLLIFFIFKNFFNYEKFEKKMEKNIHKIVINNLNNIDEDKILRNINVKVGQSFWNFNSKKLANDLNKIRGIKSFSFKMEKDGVLNIFVIEDIPFMVWKFSNKTKYLNDKGEILDFSKKNFKDLIVLEGQVNQEKLMMFNKIMSLHNELKQNIQRIYYTENIGWRLFLKDKSCLYLPDEKIDKVLNVYKKIKKSKISQNFKYFDMRILERVYLNKDNKCLIS